MKKVLYGLVDGKIIAVDYEKERKSFDKRFINNRTKEHTVDPIDGLYVWISCAEQKQAEINELKAKLAKVESGEMVIVPKNANAFMYRVFCDARDEVPIIHTPQEAFQVGYKAMIEAAQENEE